MRTSPEGVALASGDISPSEAVAAVSVRRVCISFGPAGNSHLDILAGARVSLAIALILAVVTEMQASQPGLGQNILLAQRSLRSPELYAGIVSLGIMGFVLNHALIMIEQHLLRWRSVTA